MGDHEQCNLPHFSISEDPATVGPRWRKWKRSFTICAVGRPNLDNAVVKRARLLDRAGLEVQDVFYEIMGDTDITVPPPIPPGGLDKLPPTPTIKPSPS